MITIKTEKGKTYINEKGVQTVDYDENKATVTVVIDMAKGAIQHYENVKEVTVISDDDISLNKANSEADKRKAAQMEDNYNRVMGELMVHLHFRMPRLHHLGQMVQVYKQDTGNFRMGEIIGRGDDENTWRVEGFGNRDFDSDELMVVRDGWRQRMVIDFCDDGLMCAAYTQGYDKDSEPMEPKPVRNLSRHEALRAQQACLEMYSILRHIHSSNDQRWRYLPADDRKESHQEMKESEC